jgi:hypothetical protein
MEAPYFRREKVLEFPGCRDLMDDIVPEEFAAEKNLNYNKEVSVDEGVSEDDKTVKCPTYHLHRWMRAPPRSSAVAPLPSTPHPLRRRGRTLSLPLPTIRPS